MKKKGIAAKVDGSQKDVLQQGYVGDPPPTKPKPEPEELSERELIEKRFMQRVLKQLVPGFPAKKLEKARYEELSRFFSAEGSMLLQEEINQRFRDISP